MEPLKGSIFADWSDDLDRSSSPIDPACEAESRRPPCGAGVVINLYGIRAWCGASGGAGRAAARILLVLTNPRTNKNAGLSDRALPALGRRPTDLCATALFSFQGTDASARPVSDRITDRTKGARRQSQRRIQYHRPSRMSMASAGPCPRVSPRLFPHPRRPATAPFAAVVFF
jgi:hypothetical protein